MLNPLEQFAPLLDPELMAQAFQSYLSAGAQDVWSVTDCKIQHPRYKTYRSPANKARSTLSLLYHLQGHSQESNLQKSQTYYARAYLDNRSEAAYQTALASLDADTKSHVIHLADLGLVGWQFPFDPAMPWLPELMDPQRVAELHAATHLNETPEKVEIDIVNYRPEIRCTASYRFLDANDKQIASLYGKIFANGDGQNIGRHMQQLRLQAGVEPAHFEIPHILAYDEIRHTLWLHALEGVPFRRALNSNTEHNLLGQLAQGLAGFHCLQLQGLAKIDLRDLYREWQKKADKLHDAMPQQRQSLQTLLSHLQNSFPGNNVEPGLIHGDFHADQLAVLPSGRLALFDYDELAIADPLIDLANFCADLCGRATEASDSELRLGLLFKAYKQAAAKPVCLQRFCWHLRGQFLTRAYRAHIQQVQQTEQKIQSLLDLAQNPWEHILHRYCET